MPQETAQLRFSPGIMMMRGPARRVGLLLAAVLLAMVAGCAATPPVPPEEPPTALPEPEPAPPAPVPDEPRPEPAPKPVPEFEAPDEAMVFDARAAVILSDRSLPYENVATELEPMLIDPLVYNLADKSQSHEEVFAGVAESGADIVIAIGLPAARAASAMSPVPVIYCQVFNFGKIANARVPVKGVATIPPLSLQVAAWLEVDPGLRNIGAILGAGHEELIAEAAEAAAENGLAFHHRMAASDRETLYNFKRMAPEIDGFWLFPDNRVLSVPVLRQMVDIAMRHNVRIAVFNDALLELGFAVSTAPVDSDIAETVMSVAGKITGAADSVPDLTPLNDLTIRAGKNGGPMIDRLASGSRDAGASRGRL
jgi:hypothetical protein